MSLDPDGPDAWAAFRCDAHAMLDAAIDHVQGIGDGPVWRPMPPEIRASFREPLPVEPTALADVDAAFRARILPYGSGNAHGRFVGWVQGGGNVAGMMAELYAAALDANCGGRDHAAIEVERQVVRWMAELFGFPERASGLLVTGTSLANWMAVVIAKVRALGTRTRAAGIAAAPRALRGYTSVAAHQCVLRAFEMAGLGGDALVRIPVDRDHRIDLAALAGAIARDRAAGCAPFFVAGNAGTVDIGAIDDLHALAALAAREQLWFHVDGAFGAFAILASGQRAQVAGIERADSIAYDFHKWLQVPYDAGMLLVRDGADQLAAFASDAAYLARDARGLAAGGAWPVDLGPDLSRGFRALKVWFTLKTYGLRRLGEVIDGTCALAQQLARRIAREPELELLAPVQLDIACFRYRGPGGAASVALDALNAAIVTELQESGVCAPSTTRVGGVLAIRVAFINHRTEAADVDRIVDAILERGRALVHADDL